MQITSESSRIVVRFVQSPARTGAIAASSGTLSELITEEANLRDRVNAVVEFGPGTGVFTRQILMKIRPGTTFFALELDPYFAAETRKNCPTAVVYEDCAINVRKYLAMHGVEQCDRIVSGLPWATLKGDFQEQLLAETYDVLSPGGRFVTFAYLQGLLLPSGQRFRKMLRRYFKSVSLTRIVWLNAPPAFVYCADKSRSDSESYR
jgi:phospholipid N-methyltransferase